MTVVDRLNVAGDDNNQIAWRDALREGAKADVCWSFDAPAYKALLKRALSA
jgi:hypothetical protein